MTSDRIEFLGDIAARLIQRVPLFSGLAQEVLVQFLLRTQRFAFARGQTIFREGDTSRMMYVILRGSVTLLQSAADTLDNPVGVLGAGQCFGEMALVDAAPRSATAVAGEACVLLAFSEEELCRAERLERTALKNLATVLVSRCHAMAVRLAPNIDAACYERECFSRIEACGGQQEEAMTSQAQAWLAQVGRTQMLAAGQCVVWEGSTGQALYVVMDGELEVSRTDHAMTHRLASLKPGQCFGEVGFLNDQLGRNASVRAKSDSRVLRVEARDMLRSPKVATTVYRHLARKLSNRLRGLNHAYAQIVVARCRDDCPLLRQAQPQLSDLPGGRAQPGYVGAPGSNRGDAHIPPP